MNKLSPLLTLLVGALVGAGIGVSSLVYALSSGSGPEWLAQKVAGDYPCQSLAEKASSMGFQGVTCQTTQTAIIVTVVSDTDKSDICGFQLTPSGSDAWIVRAFNGDYIQMPHPTKELIRQSTLWDSCHAYRAAHTPPGPDQRPYTS
jgi:hypothetical protein